MKIILRNLLIICVVGVLILGVRNTACGYLPLQKILYDYGLIDFSKTACSEDYLTEMMFRYDERWLISTYDKLSPSRREDYVYGKYAILSGNDKLFLRIVEKGGAIYPSEIRGRLKNNFLHEAVAVNNKELTKYLRSQFNSLKYEKDVRGNIPLHYAILHHDIELVQILADKESNNILDENGYKAYQRAAFMAVEPRILCLVLPDNEIIQRSGIRDIMLTENSAWMPEYKHEIDGYLDKIACLKKNKNKKWTEKRGRRD